MSKASPFTALALLVLFKQRKTVLTQAQFDLYVGTVVELLEEVHDEQYRLEPDQERDTWPSDVPAVSEVASAAFAPVSDDDQPSSKRAGLEHGK